MWYNGIKKGARQKMPNKITIQPDVLQHYLTKSRVPASQIKQKMPDFESYLSGEKQPTFNQLSTIAKLINTPTGLLMLSEVVDSGKEKLKFRTFNSAYIDGMSAELQDTITEMRTKQEFLRDEIEYELDFLGQFSLKDDYKEVASYIRKRLALPIPIRGSYSNPQSTLNSLRSAVNSIGVFVFISGRIKDNTHRKLDNQEFRGLVLSDKKAPIIFVNGTDTKRGQLFTLIHELVHLFIGDEEIMGSVDFSDPVEAFVNKVTAEILVPETEFLAQNSTDDEELAKVFKVSRFVIVRRLLDLRQISQAEYNRRTKLLEEEFQKLPKVSSGGGDYNKVVKARIDSRFFDIVDNAVNQNRLSFTEAFDIVGVSYKGYQILSGGVN